MNDQKTSKAADLKAAIEARLQALSALTDEARIGEEMQRYLQFLGRFHRYSFYNSLLILMSNPDATLVAGYRKWQQMGFQVRRGEQGIPILAPQACDESKKEPAAVAAGEVVVEVESEVEEPQGKTGLWFRTVYVFDVSQVGIPCPRCKALAPHDATHCPECQAGLEASLPQPPRWSDEGEDGAGLPGQAGLAARLQSYAHSLGIEVTESDLPGKRQGESHIGKVVLRRGLSPLGRASVLAHEIAHELLHTEKDRQALSRTIKETEAEATAYVVCAHFGHRIDAPNYIAMWSGDSAVLSQRMNRNAKAAGQIIEAITAGGAR